MPYYGSCASCGVSWHNKKFASARNGEHIPVYARKRDLKYYSEVNDRVDLGCLRKIEKTRPTITQTQPIDDTPLSRKEKVAIGNGMRRLLHQDGVGGRVEIPSSRGPSSTWRREIRPRVDNNNCSAETLRLRAKTMESTRESQSVVSGHSAEENEDSVERLRLAEVKRQPEEYIHAMKKAKLTIDNKLSAHETVQLQTVLKAPTKTMRVLRSFLQQHGVDIFTSEKSSRHHVTTLRHNIETGTIDWKVKVKKSKNKTKDIDATEKMKDVEVNFARVVDVAEVLNSQLDEIIRTKRFRNHGCIPDNEVWCALIGDKGGHSVKLGVNIINNETPLSRSSVYILAMYEGAGEDYELIRQIMQPIIDQLYQWQISLLETKKLTSKIFVGGDFPWMSSIHGLSDLGQFFCLFCLCSLLALADDRGNSHSPEKKRYEVRTYSHHCQQHDKYKQRNCRKIEAQDYFNCINPPLVGAAAYIHTSVMPLHAYLGVGGEIPYSILTNECSALDDIVEADNKSLGWKPAEEEYKRPFTFALNKLMKKLCVSRKGNRGHTLVGNDVHTMLQAENRERLCALLTPRKIHERNPKIYGNSVSANKLRILLELISDMYHLSTVACALTEDEISGLQSLGNELAEWYPRNYPERTITPKFHVVTHHIPQFAAKYKTVGLVSEHCLESTHAEFRKYDQRFACDGNGERALLSSLNQNMLDHDARLGTFSLQRRCCKECGQETRQLGKRERDLPDIVRCSCVSQSQ